MKTIVLYVFHEMNDNILFFIRHGVIQSADFLFICNGDINLDLPPFDNVRQINRPNIGHDFGGWSHGLHTVNLDHYDYFILINSTVRGPFIPPWSIDHDWVDIFVRLLDDKVKLVGTLPGFYKGQMHIQSMFLALDRTGIDIGLKTGVFEANPVNKSKLQIVTEKEVGLSLNIISEGYAIRSVLGAYFNSPGQLKFSKNHRIYDHGYNGGYFGTNVHPYDVVFIKENREINNNKDIELCTANHDSNFDRSRHVSMLGSTSGIRSTMMQMISFVDTIMTLFPIG